MHIKNKNAPNGAFLEQKMTEGFLQNHIKSTYNPSASRSFGTSLYTREAENAVAYKGILYKGG